MDEATPGNQMIISNQRRNVTWSDARRKTHLFSINRPRNTKFHEGTDNLISDSSEIFTLIDCLSVSLVSHSFTEFRLPKKEESQKRRQKWRFEGEK